MPANTNTTAREELILVTTANGKTGSRITDRLEAMGKRVRRGSRSAEIAFDWSMPETWGPALEGVTAAYVAYIPDLAVPAAPATITAFTHLAREMGVEKLVLLSGRGEKNAQVCEQIVKDSGMAWTIARTSWFNQNFSEGEFLEMVRHGMVTLPAQTVAEPFVDADDIADVVTAALSDPRHDGELYEITGPRLLTFAQAVETIAQATGKPLGYQPITHDEFEAGLKAAQLPEDMVWLLSYLFTEVLDGRNARVCDGVQRALGRPAKDFADFAKSAANSGVWDRESAVA
ncbi:MAG: NmrA family transcriptional regulator [Phycisphaeraceae bacterium]|nr:NmrA family transcriptional regulator [Phycisphaeraceae bacterium]